MGAMEQSASLSILRSAHDKLKRSLALADADIDRLHRELTENISRKDHLEADLKNVEQTITALSLAVAKETF